MNEKRWNMLIFVGAIVFGIASVALCFFKTDRILLRCGIYAAYALAALFFTTAIWRLIRLFRNSEFLRKFKELLHRFSFTARLCDDYAFRTMAVGYLSLALNIFFALTKAAAGVYYSSVWLCALAFYYLILCLTKALVLRRGRRKRPGETGLQRRCREWKIYRMCGILLALMTFALQGIIILIIERGNTFTYHGTLIFAVALYDFYCLISAIVYMVKTRKKHTPIVVSVKAISFATSLVAMLTLQTVMFASFSDGLDADRKKLMNIMTGTAVCVILIVQGALMIRRACTEIKKLQEGQG